MLGALNYKRKNEVLRGQISTLRARILKRDKQLNQLTVATDPLGDMVNAMPEGVIIRRIWPKTTGYQWKVQYRWNGVPYYGATLEEALGKLFTHNVTMATRYADNLTTVRGPNV